MKNFSPSGLRGKIASATALPGVLGKPHNQARLTRAAFGSYLLGGAVAAPPGRFAV